jgi:hypothetical protein
MKRFRRLALLGILFSSSTSFAGFDPSFFDLSQLNNLIPQDIANEAAKTMGILLVHRPYQGAISIFEPSGFEVKIETTMIKIGDGIINALEANGVNNASLQQSPAVPMLKGHIRKALGPSTDIGISGIFYQGQYVVGGDFKFNIYDPEEGLSSAIRLGYTLAKVPQLNLQSLSVITPELVFSRRLSFAEPYIGIGGRFISGTVSAEFPIIGTLEKSGSGTTGYAFTGVNFMIGSKGLRLAFEGNYDLSGFSSIGTMFGFGI